MSVMTNNLHDAQEAIVAEERRQAALARGDHGFDTDKENMARPDLARKYLQLISSTTTMEIHLKTAGNRDSEIRRFGDSEIGDSDLSRRKIADQLETHRTCAQLPLSRLLLLLQPGAPRRCATCVGEISLCWRFVDS
jgi:hypothetical protein